MNFKAEYGARFSSLILLEFTDMTTLPIGIVENTTNKTCEQLSLTNNDYLKILWTSAAELPGKCASH